MVRLFVCSVLSFALPLIIGSAAFGQDAPRQQPPNFVIIFADDLGYGDVGVFGSETNDTPHIDKMATEGRIFRDFYVSTPMCSGSRAALMTGCYPRRINVKAVYFPGNKEGLNPEETTIAEVLKSRGYATACIGKWHLGDQPEFLPTNQGFNLYFGIPYSNDMDRKVKKGRGVNGLDEAWKLQEEANSWWNVPLLRNEEIIERPADQTTLTDRYTAEAVKFIEENREQPFFLYMPHTMPHVPLFVSDERYDPDPHKAYELVVEHIDASVGAVLEALEKAGVADTTLVIFTSDNGPWLGKKHHAGTAAPLRGGKFSAFEGGVREPTVMRWPARIPAGTECTQVASTIDLLPTLAKIAGADLPERKIDGKDILPLMTDEPGAKSPHEDGFYYWSGTSEVVGVRMGDWKVLRTDKDDPTKAELYNLAEDISEEQDLAAEHPEIVVRGQEKITAFQKSIEAEDRPAGRVDG